MTRSLVIALAAILLGAVGPVSCVLPSLDGALVRCDADADCPSGKLCVVELDGEALCRDPGDPCVAITDGVARQQPDGTPCAAGICVGAICVAPVCGDGVVSGQELCDDGERNSDQAPGACRSDCRPARCGDGVIDGAEQCDDAAANSDNEPDACRSTCVLAACGDGVVDGNERCDEGPANSDVRPDACRTTCVEAICGDGTRDLDEACDEGELNSDLLPEACRLDCTRARCGDGVIDEGETCDDGDGNDDVAVDACRTTCVPAGCGDGVIDTGERCDDGLANSDLTPNACRSTCVPAACGDNIRDSDEECDEGAGNDDEAPDACRSDCRRARCGDGVQDAPERCDDGNTDSGDGCRGDCSRVEVCGNRVVDAGEDCDDGLENPRDGCDACRNHVWGVEVVARGRSLGESLSLTGPMGVAVDASGAVYIADTLGNRVLREKDGVTTVFAGTGTAGFSGDGGPAIAAELRGPSDVVVASTGDVYIVDRLNDRVRLVTLDTLEIRTIVGGGEQDLEGAIDADGRQLRLRRPRGITISGTRLLITEEEGGRIRETNLRGIEARTVVGSNVAAPLLDGIALRTGRLQQPTDVARVSDTEFVVAEAGSRTIRFVRTSAIQSISTIAGGGSQAPGPSAIPALQAQLIEPTALLSDGTRVFVGDAGLRRVLTIDDVTANPRTIRVIVGSGNGGAHTPSGPLLTTDLGRPVGLAGVPGTLYVADERHHVVRQVDADSVDDLVGTGQPAFGIEDTLATTVSLLEPVAAVPDRQGGVFIADRGARRVYRRTPSGHLRTVMGTGDGGEPKEGVPAITEPVTPTSIAAKADGTLIVSIVQETTGSIFAVGANGIVTRVANVDVGFEVNGILISVLPLTVDSDDRVVFAVPGFIGVEDPGSSGGPVDGFALFSIDDAAVPRAIASMSADRIALVGDDALTVVTLDFTTGTASFQSAVEKFAGRGVAALGDNDFLVSSDKGLERIGLQSPRVTVASASSERGGDGVPIEDSILFAPAGLSVDVDGRILLADVGAGLVRRFDLTDGTLVETIAGDIHPTGPGTLPGAALQSPRAINVLTDGSLLVSGTSGRLLHVAFDGVPRVDVAYGNPLGRPPNEDVLARFAQPLTNSATMATGSGSTVAILDGGRHRTLRVEGDPSSWVLDGVVQGQTGGVVAAIALPEGLAVSNTGHDCVHFFSSATTIPPATATLFGRCGSGGPFDDLVLDPGGLAVSPTSGAIYLADTGNNRVLRLFPPTVGGTVSVVMGDGSSSSAGQGSPAREFPLQEPAHVAVDGFGNLFVSSKTTVKMVANVDGDLDADGDDRVITIFGAPPRDAFPESESRCLEALALDDERGHVYVADACSSFLVKLTPVIP